MLVIVSRGARRVPQLDDRITNEQFAHHVPIGENEIYRERLALTQVDGPVPQYPRWFRQLHSGSERPVPDGPRPKG